MKAMKVVLAGLVMAASVGFADDRERNSGTEFGTAVRCTNTVSGSNHVRGCGNVVSGMGNVVIGHNNVVSGVNNRVCGNNLVVSGVGGNFGCR